MCRTFSLPEIKHSDLYAAAAKAGQAFNLPETSNFTAECLEGDLWLDDDLAGLLDQFPSELGELEMECEYTTGADDSSVGAHSASDDSLSSMEMSFAPMSMPPSLMLPQPEMPIPVLPTYDMGTNFGLRAPQDGYVSLPSSHAFAHISYKTPEMLREEKLCSLDPFIGALNEGDLFSLYSICQSQCAPNTLFSSQSCGFAYTGSVAVIAFWTLLFQEHYQANLSCLSRRTHSSLKPMSNNTRGWDLTSSGSFESVEFVLKLEGCRLSEFRAFELFKQLMGSGYVHDNLSLPELISLTEAFYKQSSSSASSVNSNNTSSGVHKLYQTVYLFEVKLQFHALTHAITRWSFELLAVDCR